MASPGSPRRGVPPLLPPALLLLLLLAAPAPAAAGFGGRSSGGGSRSSFSSFSSASKPSSAKPAMGTPAYPRITPLGAPPASSAGGLGAGGGAPMAAGALGGAGGGAAAAAARPGGFGGFGGSKPASGGFGASKPGFRPTALALPFAAGMLAGGAMSSLTRDKSAYCNGFSVKCYYDACQGGLTRCQSANSTKLVPATCPDPRFSECWQSEDAMFTCNGVRRPKFDSRDISASCNTPDGASSPGGDGFVAMGGAGARAGQLGLVVGLAAMAVALVV